MKLNEERIGDGKERRQFHQKDLRIGEKIIQTNIYNYLLSDNILNRSSYGVNIERNGDFCVIHAHV